MLRISWTRRTKRCYGLQERAGHCSTPFELESYRFFGHIMRHDSIKRDLIEGMVEGKRERGRPRLQWSDNITQWTGFTFVDAKRADQDRRRWRSMAGNVSRHATRKGKVKDPGSPYILSVVMVLERSLQTVSLPTIAVAIIMKWCYLGLQDHRLVNTFMLLHVSSITHHHNQIWTCLPLFIVIYFCILVTIGEIYNYVWRSISISVNHLIKTGYSKSQHC